MIPTPPAPKHLHCSQAQACMSLPEKALGPWLRNFRKHSFWFLLWHSFCCNILTYICYYIILFPHFHHTYQHPNLLIFYTFPNLITIPSEQNQSSEGTGPKVCFCSPIIKLHLHISNSNSKNKIFLFYYEFP